MARLCRQHSRLDYLRELLLATFLIISLIRFNSCIVIFVFHEIFNQIAINFQVRKRYCEKLEHSCGLKPESFSAANTPTMYIRLGDVVYTNFGHLESLSERIRRRTLLHSLLVLLMLFFALLRRHRLPFRTFRFDFGQRLRGSVLFDVDSGLFQALQVLLQLRHLQTMQSKTVKSKVALPWRFVLSYKFRLSPLWLRRS